MAKDLTGQRFGKLVALRPTGEQKDWHAVWECQCDCGRIVFVREGNLKSGNTKSCGCARTLTQARNYAKDLSGQRFGKLITLERKGEQNIWECQCDCGKIVLVRESNLRSGHTKSCGCGRLSKLKGRDPKDLTGQRFGMLVVQRPTDMRERNSVVWECQCDCGKTVFVTVNSLTYRNTTSCGCVQTERFPHSTGKNIAGQRFGKLVALRPTEERKNGFVMWECLCDCGNTILVRSSSLKSGHTQSCGCLHKMRI